MQASLFGGVDSSKSDESFSVIKSARGVSEKISLTTIPKYSWDQTYIDFETYLTPLGK